MLSINIPEISRYQYISSKSKLFSCLIFFSSHQLQMQTHNSRSTTIHPLFSKVALMGLWFDLHLHLPHWLKLRKTMTLTPQLTAKIKTQMSIISQPSEIQMRLGSMPLLPQKHSLMITWSLVLMVSSY